MLDVYRGGMRVNGKNRLQAALTERSSSMGDKGRKDRAKKKRQKSAQKHKKARTGNKPHGGTGEEGGKKQATE
mgnify:CR=1 FL=1